MLNGSMPSFAALRSSASTFALSAGRWHFGIQQVVLLFWVIMSVSPLSFLRVQVSVRGRACIDAARAPPTAAGIGGDGAEEARAGAPGTGGDAAEGRRQKAPC